ncbi:hypothetical protein PHMEG_00018026 [Phytophthora megakarya]|uniref:Uncharacterized protein n=1 Tax=Phytophthora megakarya TaxID=4795 RepID=A0A225VWC6_9STRA|nr:hypothetical protein PHMEG_00018026 [Phytophthora megakarya]
MDAKQKKIIALPEQPEQIEQWLTAMKSSIRTMHKPMMTERNQKRHQHAKQQNFDVDDYVLRSKVDHNHQDKLLVTWIGPCQITRADSHSFVVKYLVMGEETDVHSSRLSFMLTITCGPKKDYDILVSWKGLEPIVDSLESAKFLARGIPVLLNEFAVAREDARFERHVLALTGQHNTSD